MDASWSNTLASGHDIVFKFSFTYGDSAFPNRPSHVHQFVDLYKDGILLSSSRDRDPNFYHFETRES